MIDEKTIFEELNDGKSLLNVDIHYVATIFARHYRQFGLNTPEVRAKLEEWAKKFDIYILSDVNRSITKVVRRNEHLKPFEPIKITRRDINFIIDNIKTSGRRRVYFGLLVYGKFRHDEIGTFVFPVKTFSAWLGLANPSNLYTRHIPWLCENNFVENVATRLKHRGMPVEDGYMALKMDYLVDNRDNTPIVLEIKDNDIMKYYDMIDWNKRL